MTRHKTSIGCILFSMAASLAVAVPPASARPASDVAGHWQATALTTTYQPSPTDPTAGSGSLDQTRVGRSTQGGTGTISFSSAFTVRPDGHVLAVRP